ncbi:hypothetical protein QIS74_04877 [Colletotrichum tabaci]|uniref:Uncharacterized protein n=1 Tax=Colletotrichum tabaci TaxID=1209068 RepID=A0AAV9TIQ1_9PEZI
MRFNLVYLFFALSASGLSKVIKHDIPAPPTPEPIGVTELPLPPVTNESCTPELNPKGTGCIGLGKYGAGFQIGGFLPDSRHIVAHVTYAGAPSAPDPASIYEGQQIVLIKTDGTTKGEPLAPRYDLVNVTRLSSLKNDPPFAVNRDQLTFNPLTNFVGELRGFSGRGGEVSYIGHSVESSNIDVFAVERSTGKVRRLTAHPEYVDPVDISPDDEWTAAMDTRGSDRQMQRGAINDPEWDGRADPKWSPDGTKIVYWQDLTASPACGGNNPLPCYPSPYQGGRYVRFMVANLTSREPVELPRVEPVSDGVPWGTPYMPGQQAPGFPRPSEGKYTLRDTKGGYANVTIIDNEDLATICSIRESFTRTNPSVTIENAVWFSDLVQTGNVNATKKTSSNGFRLSIDVLTNIFDATGNLTTTINGVVYKQPANRT